ncbi:hypothetical protein RKD28_002311 [Streptomyces sp. SAI-229]
MWPWKTRPIWSGSGWVQRMPRGSMIVTKSMSVSRTTASAYGWSSADGSGVRIASRTEGESAIERATEVAWRPAACSAWLRSLT